MNRDEILAALNAEIDHLTAVRNLMSSGSQAETPRRAGRPKGLSKEATSMNLDELVPKKTRTMSAEGKARVAEAQRKRWAAQKRKPAQKGLKTQVTPVGKGASAAKKTTKPAARRTATKATPKKRSPLPAQPKKDTTGTTE